MNFKDTPNNKNDEDSRLFKQNKTKKWTYSNNHHTANTCVESAKKDIKQSKTFTLKKTKPNLSQVEKVSLKHLSKLDDIIITNAGMGGAVVIMDANRYIREAKRQLIDSENKFFLRKFQLINSN